MLRLMWKKQVNQLLALAISLQQHCMSPNLEYSFWYAVGRGLFNEAEGVEVKIVVNVERTI